MCKKGALVNYTKYERFPDEFPTTSTPSIDEIMKVYEEKQKEGYENLIVICISSKMSGTYNAARLAAEEYDDLNNSLLNEHMLTNPKVIKLK